MTKEEAIAKLTNMMNHCYPNEDYKMAIKALEQEPKTDMLDKIRAEIEQDAFKDVNGSKYIFVNRINQIIDKYRAESEVSDANSN